MIGRTLCVATSMVLASTLFTPVASADVYPSCNTGGTTVLRYFRSGFVNFNPGQAKTLFSQCATRQCIVGGGFSTNTNGADGFHVIHNHPTSNRRWEVRLRNEDVVPRRVRIYRICAQ